MNEINETVINQFKERIKLDGEFENDNLNDILTRSISVLLIQVGAGYSIEEHPQFKELVFERARYVYNDAIEYFNDNFQSEITLLQMSNPILSVEEAYATWMRINIIVTISLVYLESV